MGLFSHLVVYSIGKRRGRRKAQRGAVPDCVDTRDEGCSNYVAFCRSYGSCDGMECEYE